MDRDLFLVIPTDALFNLLSRVDIPELQALLDNSPQRQFMFRHEFMRHYNAETQRRTRSAWIVIHRWNSWEDQWVQATRETDGYQIIRRLPALFFENPRYPRSFHLVGVVESNVIFFCENHRFCILNLLTNRGRVIEISPDVDLGIYYAIWGTRFTRTLGRLAFVHHVVYYETINENVWLYDFAYNTQPQHQANRLLDHTEEFGTFDYVRLVMTRMRQFAFYLLGSPVYHLRPQQEVMRDLEVELPNPRLSFIFSNDGYLVIQGNEVNNHGVIYGPTSIRLARMGETGRYEWVATLNEPLLPEGTGVVSRSRLRVSEDSVVCYMFRWTEVLTEEDENENEEDDSVELGATEYIFYMFNLDTRLWLPPRRIQIEGEPGYNGEAFITRLGITDIP